MQGNNQIEDASVQAYIASVSTVSSLLLSPERQRAHVSEFKRLLADANALSELMGRDEHRTVSPLVVVRHHESDRCVQGSGPL